MGITKLMGREFYDGEKLWRVWTGMGRASSYKKLQKWCEANGMVNPNTGKASAMGPYWAMWKWAFRNPEKAYPLYKEWAEQYLSHMVENGYLPTWENFLLELKDKAKRHEVASPTKYEKFLKDYNLAP